MSSLKEIVNPAPGEEYILSLLRPHLLNFRPYICARHTTTQLQQRQALLLDANENAFGSCLSDPPSTGLHRYPDPFAVELCDKIAAFRDVSANTIFAAMGSDSVLDYIIQAFCKPGIDKILISPPTYGMYKVIASMHDIAVVEVPLTETFELDTKQILQSVSSDVKIIFVCSPNNPSGVPVKKNDVIHILQNFPGLVVLDEAYVDFASHGSYCHLVSEYANLIVTQTFSKSFGLAGLRLGYSISRKLIADIFKLIKCPYNLSSLAQHYGEMALQNLNIFTLNCDKIKAERGRIGTEVKSLVGVGKVFPSSGNFVFFRVLNAEEIFARLKKQGIVLRFQGHNLHCKDCLRITIGTSSENNRMLAVLKDCCIDVNSTMLKD